MKIRDSRLGRRLASLAAAAALAIGASVALGAAPAQAGGSWDMVASYDDYSQCLVEGPQWIGGPVIDFSCTYAGGVTRVGRGTLLDRTCW